jgi:phenylacetate-coenzyme A ligase PaaK-like adenylate-forming protein
LRLSLRHIATSAEVLTPRVRARVHEAWGVAVRDTYGATEYAPIASECEQGNKHLFEDGAIIEVVDEAGRAVADGSAGARVLLTVLERHTQPLIRYELSDVLRLKPGRCACGRPFRMVDEIEGRIEEILEFPRRAAPGERVAIHPNIFHELLERVPAAGWQVVQRPGALDIRFVGVPDAHPLGELAELVRAALADRGAEPPAVSIERATTLERGATGKAPLIMALRAAAGGRSQPGRMHAS